MRTLFLAASYVTLTYVAVSCRVQPQVMGALMKKHRGEFDGKEANKWVGEMLSP